MSEIRGNCKLLAVRKPSPPLSGTIFPHKRHLGKGLVMLKASSSLLSSSSDLQFILIQRQILHHKIYSHRICIFYNVSFASLAEGEERMYILGRGRVNFDYWRQHKATEPVTLIGLATHGGLNTNTNTNTTEQASTRASRLLLALLQIGQWALFLC